MSTIRFLAQAIDLNAAAPDRIPLFPRGPDIVARDGRRWKLADLKAVVAAFEANKADLPIDYEHAQDHLAPKGLPAPAAGWITRLAIEDGVIMGDVAWTPAGKASIESREYRYFSPSFMALKADKSIVRIDGGALVNRPALVMPELAGIQEENSMDKELAAVLGVAETATTEQALAAAKALKSAAEKPDLSKFVPRADLDAALARASDAEKKLTDGETAARKAKAEALVNEAVKSGKVAPASKEFYLARASTDAELAELEKHLTQLGAIIPGTTGLEDKETGKAAGALTPEEKALCASMGISEADFIKAKAA